MAQGRKRAWKVGQSGRKIAHGMEIPDDQLGQF